MTSQLNYLIVQQRHIELAHRAEQARLADDAPRRVGVVPTLESRPAPRDASAPGCQVGHGCASSTTAPPKGCET